MRKLLMLFLLTAIASSCSNEDSLFKIDNPSNKTIKIEVDGNTLNIAPNSFNEVSLKSGEHNLKLIEGTFADGKSVNIYVYPNSSGGIINPTMSDYVIVRALYIKDESNLKNFGIGYANKKWSLS